MSAARCYVWRITGSDVSASTAIGPPGLSELSEVGSPAAPERRDRGGALNPGPSPSPVQCPADRRHPDSVPPPLVPWTDSNAQSLEWSLT